MVVLSSNEKYRYALATLEPVLNTLSQLSTVELFQRLSQLETAAHDFSRQYLDHNAVPAGEDLRPQEGGDEEGPSGDEDAFDDVGMPEMIRGTTENNNFEDQQRDREKNTLLAQLLLRVLEVLSLFRIGLVRQLVFLLHPASYRFLQAIALLLG
ncbi:hypothetical protein GN958_ATG23564 [Phytophthora infestans]|uniref:Uncharacterized protein n=1 Tax=Phytophthora infestans TaxID=4787 RepID=A0A8S9TGU3_PHYIN|nr:hypothetical protein GN958_ATG23564 [Phytophthora infestans]